MPRRIADAAQLLATVQPPPLPQWHNWITSEEDLLGFGAAFTDVAHFPVLLPAQTRCPVPPKSMELGTDDIRHLSGATTRTPKGLICLS
jgi:hypothetical protein